MNSEKKTCVVCHSYLFDDDDVVYCPVCGAPHHRDCYNAIGKCGLEALHGTDKQYDKIKAETPPESKLENKAESNPIMQTKCQICGESYDMKEPVCPNCGAPNYRIISGFSPFDALGGVPKDIDLGEGVTADEAKRFVMANSQRYIPKFAAMSMGKKLSWNWFAFLFPSGFLLSRKMYLKGTAVGLVSVILRVFEELLGLAVYNAGGVDAYSYQSVYSVLGAVDKKILIFGIIAFFLDFVLRIVLGLIGDRIYKNHAVSKVAEIKKNSSDIEEDMNRKGGINFFTMLIGIFGINLISNLLAAML